MRQDARRARLSDGAAALDVRGADLTQRASVESHLVLVGDLSAICQSKKEETPGEHAPRVS